MYHTAMNARVWYSLGRDGHMWLMALVSAVRFPRRFLFQTGVRIGSLWLTMIMLLRVLPYIFLNWFLMRFKSISLLETMFLIRVPSRVPAPWIKHSNQPSLPAFLVHLHDNDKSMLGPGVFCRGWGNRNDSEALEGCTEGSLDLSLLTAHIVSY